MGEYFRPKNIESLLVALPQREWTFLAGGTDYFPSIVGRTDRSDLMDVTALSELSGVTEDTNNWRIGAISTWSQILKSDLPPLFDGLKAAAREIGGVQIQNSATIGGNICNASPAADGVVALLALDAKVEILSDAEKRLLPLNEFVLGNRKIALKTGEIVSAIIVPKPLHQNAIGSFYKLGARRYLVISMVMVSGVLILDADKKISGARIVVGACSEVAERLIDLERALEGQELSEKLPLMAKEHHFLKLNPIDDARASKVYRLRTAKTLVTQMLADWGQGHG